MKTPESALVVEVSQENKKEVERKSSERKEFVLEKSPESKASVEDHKHADELLKNLKSKKFLEGDYSEKKREPKIFKELDKIHIDAVKQKIELVKKVTTNAADFIPFFGSAKMFAEGLRGKQYGTEKEIKGYERFLHTIFGAGFFALDCTGVGIIADELGKGVIKLGQHAALRTAEEVIARQIIKKEAAALAARGMIRIAKKEKIATNA